MLRQQHNWLLVVDAQSPQTATLEYVVLIKTVLSLLFRPGCDRLRFL